MVFCLVSLINWIFRKLLLINFTHNVFLFNLNCLFSFCSWLGCSWRSSKLFFYKFKAWVQKRGFNFFAISSTGGQKRKPYQNRKSTRGSRITFMTRERTRTRCSQHTSRARQIQNQTACVLRCRAFFEVSRIVVAFGNLCCSVLAILTSLSSKKNRASTCARRGLLRSPRRRPRVDCV